MAKKHLNYDELAELNKMFEGNKEENKQEEKKEEEIRKEKVREEKKQEEKKDKPVSESNNVKNILENISYKDKPVFSKEVIYVSDQTKKIAEALSELTGESLKYIADKVFLYFYENNKEQINKEYKELMKKKTKNLL